MTVQQTQVTGVQLLGELLLERSNLKVMVRYVADEANLKLMMNLLRDSSRSIQFEAFHVFKVRDAYQLLCCVSLPSTVVMCMSNIVITGDQVHHASRRHMYTWLKIDNLATFMTC